MLKIGTVALASPVILAPMAGITSWPFRLLCRRFGASLAFTEMISASAIARRKGTAENLFALKSHPADRPLGIQLFGADPADLAAAAQDLSALEADLIDLNFGCPVRKVVKSGAGVALMRDLAAASRLLRAVRRVVSVPLTVKMRLGWDEGSRNAPELAEICEAEGVDAVTVHGRTRVQGFGGEADLEGIAEVAAAVKIPVIGNGGIMSAKDARRMIEVTGCAGVMAARGARGNPWLFAELTEGEDSPRARASAGERAVIIREHFQGLKELLGRRKAVLEMRKHLAWYSRGLPRAVELRRELHRLASADQLEELLERYFLVPTAP